MANLDHSAGGAARVSTRWRRGRNVAELPAVPALFVPAAARASILPQLLPSMKPEVAPEPLRHTRMTLPQAANPVQPRRSGDGKTRRVGLSGAVASLVVVVPCVTRRGTGHLVCAFGMICPRVRGGAGLAPAAGLIRSLSALWA